MTLTTSTTLWQDFWSSCGPDVPRDRADLFRQVAHTVHGQPITDDVFSRMLERIAVLLELSSGDRLVDFCCGNGLVSHDLASRVASFTGIDFVARNVRVANESMARHNTTYVLGDVRAGLSDHIGSSAFPNKFLMNASLGYFQPEEFDRMLHDIVQHMHGRPFRFLISGIPRFDLKRNFYDTPERIKRHLTNEARQSNFNDGIGRWWTAEEICRLARAYRLDVQCVNQPVELSNYRMDAIINPGSTTPETVYGQSSATLHQGRDG